MSVSVKQVTRLLPYQGAAQKGHKSYQAAEGWRQVFPDHLQDRYALLTIKTFLPVSLSLGGVGLAYYLYTFLTGGRLTHMSTMLFMSAIIVFIISLVSEQITMLIYQRRDSDRE